MSTDGRPNAEQSIDAFALPSPPRGLDDSHARRIVCGMSYLQSWLPFAPLFLVPACSSTTYLGPAPEITDLSVQPLDPSDTTRISGSVHVQDPEGLTTLLVNVTIDGGGKTVSLPPASIDTTVVGQLEATVGFRVKSKTDFGSGTYRMTVTLTEAGTPSNPLTSTFVVQ
jgi:hypothetical protein